jgi:DNA replication and repair protein RecF
MTAPGVATDVEPEQDACARLRHLTVRDFRNLRRVDLSLPPAGVVVVGDNGQGKTNLLEATHYLSLLRSVRGARDRDVVRFGAGGFFVSADVEGLEHRTVSVGFEVAGGRKKVMLDEVPTSALSEALGAVPSVYVSPSDVDLVGGGPVGRRRYLDVVLALTTRRYLQSLQRYRAALTRRNAALRQVERGGHALTRAAVWEPALAEHGATLVRERARWVEWASERFAALCAEMGEHAPVSMRYETDLEISAAGEPLEEDLVAKLASRLEAARTRDVRRGLTTVGPHRDDLELALGDRPMRLFSSAGQQRTAALALRLLECETHRDRVSRQPIVLLDDPFAELDRRRAARVPELLSAGRSGQCILAIPRADDVPAGLPALEMLTIRDGVVGW